MPVDDYHPAHHGQVVQANPVHAAIACLGGNDVTVKVCLLGIAQLAEINRSRFVRGECEPGQVVVHSACLHLEADARRLFARVGEKQD